MRAGANVVDLFSTCARIVLAGAVFGLAGCQVGSLNGPNRVVIGDTFTYTMEYSGTHSATNVTPVIVAQVPVGWSVATSSYSGTANGAHVSGSGTGAPSDPTGCSLPTIPAGYQHIVFTIAMSSDTVHRAFAENLVE